MEGHRPAGQVTLLTVGVIVLALGVLAGGILGHAVFPTTAKTSVTDHIYLSVAYNPFTGLDEYFPANFTVPADTPVVFTITNYDNGTNLIANEYSQVRGTVGGTETVTNASVANAVLQSLPVDQVAHTFTLMSGAYDVNVPIPAAQDQTPTVVTFTLVFSQAGQFMWNCMAPCDDAAMTTPGFMTGTISVTEA